MKLLLVQQGSQLICRIAKSLNIRRIDDENDCIGVGKVGPPLGSKLVSSPIVLASQVQLVFNLMKVAMAQPYPNDQFPVHI